MSEKHYCHIRYCTKEVPPEMFACNKHWLQVPANIRREIWRHYRAGQEVYKTPSPEWLEAARRAQEAVEKREFENCLQSHGVQCGCWNKAKKALSVTGE